MCGCDSPEPGPSVGGKVREVQEFHSFQIVVDGRLLQSPLQIESGGLFISGRRRMELTWLISRFCIDSTGEGMECTRI